jgi:hypothetical protein
VIPGVPDTTIGGSQDDIVTISGVHTGTVSDAQRIVTCAALNNNVSAREVDIVVALECPDKDRSILVDDIGA